MPDFDITLTQIPGSALVFATLLQVLSFLQIISILIYPEIRPLRPDVIDCLNLKSQKSE